MKPTGITPQDVEDVRVCLLRWVNRHGISLAYVAHHYRVDLKRLYRFVEGDRLSADFAVELVRRLPLGLAYRPPMISAVDLPADGQAEPLE